MMKKGTIVLLLLMVLGMTFSCNDPYSEIEKEEILEMPMTDDDDDTVGKPGSENTSSQTSG